MATIDERVVAMSFENARFEAGIAQTMAGLTKLNESLANIGKINGLQNIEAEANKVHLEGPMSALDRLKAKLGATTVGSTFSDMEKASEKVGLTGPMTALDRLKAKLGVTTAGTTFTDMERAADRISFSGLTSALDGIGSHLSLIQTTAAVAFGGMATQATMAGIQLAKSLSLEPITGGLQEYATNLNSIQTILANTQAQGSNLQDVNDALQVLNKYSDQTIYNFSQMAANIGTFTAAGVKLGPATDAIKGIANLAALSGSNAQQASTAMYQLSQAIAAGKVSLQDWNSVVNAGLGGEVFQKALFDTAKAAGTLTNVPVGQTFEEWKKAGNSFRQSLSATQKEASNTTAVLKKAHQDAAKTVSDAQQAAADSVEAAAGRVKDAEVGVADAARQAATDIADATKAQSDTIKRSGEDVRAALDGVREARKRLAEAMKPPSKDELQAAADNLKTSQLDQRDLSTAVTDAQREQKRSAEDLAAAQQKLAELIASGASPADIQAAQRAVEDAQHRVKDAADAQTRALLEQRAATRDVDQAEQDLQTTREKGTKKDANVKTAQDALTAAIEKYKDTQVKSQEEIAAAAARVADTQRKAADNQRKAGQRLADAEKEQAKTIVDAQKSVAAAHTEAARQIKAARDSISKKGPESWLTSDVLTKTLAQFTGDMTDAQLKAQGFTDEQIKAIRQTALTAKNAATQVKTLGQVFDVAKETIGSGWATTFQTIFGNFGESKKTFTELSNTINGFINTNAKARNKVLADWKALGGRTELIAGIKNAFEALGSVLKPIKDAFRQIFPPKTGQELFDLTKRFADLMERLKVGPETADGLRRTFAGLFAVLDIGWTIVKKILGVIGDLFGVVGSGSGGFLAITGSIGDFLVAMDKAISKGDALKGFFAGISGLLQVPLRVLQAITSAFLSLFTGIDVKKGDAVAGSLKSVGDTLAPLAGTMDVLSRAWDRLVGVLDAAWQSIEPTIQKIEGAFNSFLDTISNIFKGANFSTVLDAIQTGLLGGIFLAIKKGLGKGVNLDFGGGVLKNITKTFEALTGNLQAMQKNIQAGTLLKIAAAIGVLAAGVLVLSEIDPKKLTRAMTAVAVGLGELVGALALLSKFAGGTSFITMPLIAGSLVALAIAVTILAGAMKIFATMSWEELIKGLAGVGGVLLAMAGPLELIGPQVLVVAPGILVLAGAMLVLGAAMKIFATMSWEELAKGILGMAVGLAAIGLAMDAVPPSALIIGPALIGLGIGLSILAGAISSFGSMNLVQLAQGILGAAAALSAIGLAVSLIPPTVALQAAGLVILAIALNGIASAIKLMGSMDLESIIKGITAIAGVLLVLAIGLEAMGGTLPGSVALLAAAAAFAILAPTLAFLGTLKWGTIFKGLAAIALTLGTLAIVGALAAVPLAALGAALIALGLGLLVAVAPIYVLAKALQLLGSEGTKGVAVMVAALTAFIAILPKIIISFIQGLVSVVGEVAKVAPAVLLAIGTMLDSIIAFVIEAAPKLAVAVGALIVAFLQVINDNAPSIIAAGLGLLVTFLSGISGNIGMVTLQVASIITGFLTSLTGSAPQLAVAGITLLLALLGGIASKFPAIAETVATMIVKFVGAIADHISDITGAAINLMVKFLAAVASFVPKMIVTGTEIILHFLDGIGRASVRLVEKGVEVIGKFIEGIAKGMVRLANAGADAVIDFLNGIADAIRTKGPQLRAAGWNVADALMDGIWDGIHQLGQRIVDAMGDLIKLLPKKARQILGIASPSKVFAEIGRLTMAGMSVGISDGSSGVSQSMTSAAQNAVDIAKTEFGKVPSALDGLIDMNPVITPVLDLSKVQKDAKQLAGMTNVVPITAAASFDQAAAISDSQRASETVAADQAAQAITTISLTQNNTSPESLSEIEIYRQTNNQLAQLKSVVGLA